MRFSVSIQPSGHAFTADGNETILEAALRQGLTLPYGCRDGACGACKGQVLAGEVDHGKAQAHALTEDERAAGKTLFCCATAKSDLVIESREARKAGDIPVRTLPARVQSLEQVAPDVMIVRLALPASERLQFLAGQYIDILLKDGRRRSFSLANAPHDDSLLELHVRLVPGGLFTTHVFSTMKEKDILRINGPHGNFFLREESARPLLLVAGGTGFAPVKAIVEHALAEGCTRPIVVYWGGRASADLYRRELAESWGKQGIDFVPVLSAPGEDDVWQGRTGFVHEAVMADFPDLSGHQVYVCGSPAMVAAARRDFRARCALPEDEFFADSFDFANDKA
ncbi:MAG: CDP-6-deoxy-delta-3,4-glucoseen reductase [Azospira sp.]|jgi:CDP-4-dehydro-6-deoxyglucose reductase|nr:CDP-6-deoxy-delta-3,4-glucoseen reductase [Azospira sp.]